MRRPTTDRIFAKLRLLLAVFFFVLSSACTGGINAGEKGGQAFIAMTGMLLLMLAILWIILGREK